MAAVTICSDLFHGVYEISFSKLIFTKWQLTKIYIYTRNYIVYTFIQKYIYNIHIYKNIQEITLKIYAIFNKEMIDIMIFYF